VERVKAWLAFAGKGEQKVAAVFGLSPDSCDRAVRYLRRELPQMPVWLFITRPPRAETAGLCERVVVEGDSMALLVAAQKALWPRWVTLSLACWTGDHGGWPVKLAPLLIPPFRGLLMNELADFFPARPQPVATHAARRLRDAAVWLWNRLRDVNRGLWLLLFASIAQWSSPISRRAFRKHGTESLPVGSGFVTPGHDGAAVTLHYTGRKWDRDKLNRQIRGSTDRYVLLQQDSSADDLADLQPLFDDPRTFAVSRQTAYRLWHPMIFATAPFRQLQAGTASRTLAPAGPAILLDREKLLAVGGIPDTVVPGTALLLLFWKAAAAGWISYSGGGTKQLEEIVDWPYEEAEFVVRVLADPALKRVGPRDPDLSRGSISFQIREPARFTPGRLRVLVVSPYLPYPLSHGGAVRIYNLCRALSDRVDLILATFREKDDYADFDKLHEVFREVYVVDIDEKLSRNASLPRQVRGHVSPSMRALIAQLCRDRAIDVLQVEFTHLAAFRDAAPEVPAILVEHDLTFTLYRQLAEREQTTAARAEYERWYRFERHWLSRYDAVWTMSGDDNARALDEGAPAGRTTAVANGVDIERFVPCAEHTTVPEVFYVGSFRHLPNILGFERLRHEIMPRVWEKFPQARLRVVSGPDPERYWREAMKRDMPAFDPRIEVHAFVEDLRPLYAKASVVVIPLVVSAGTNIKVMEAMACRKAVVSTPVGCTGLGLIDGEDVVIRKESPEFADAVIELLADPARRQAIAAAARHTVERRFSWRAIAGEAYASYLQIAGAKVP
jgi:glycosyltransferase involved in cell wall biosynthesis